ncbi:unnamed protein product, partial [Didymodactylos carnosus]
MLVEFLSPSEESKTLSITVEDDEICTSKDHNDSLINVTLKDEKSLERETWPTKCDYLITTLGGLVGLGSIWRFPYLAFQNGGAAFVIPYFIISSLCGIPLLIMETALGQFSSKGSVGCWDFAPVMKGIGIASVFISFFGALYYVIIMVCVVASVEKFWSVSVLNKSHDLSGLLTFHWPNVVGLFSLFPYVPMIALFIRGITLEGSWYGLRYYIIPDVKRLLSAKAWTQAAGHVLWAYGIGWGIIPALSSYNRSDYNFFRDTLITGIISILTNVFSGFIIFPVLGFMAVKKNVTIDKVLSSGDGLAFIVYPKAISLMPWAHFWAVTFFIMIFLLGIDSQFVTCESVLTAAIDKLAQLRQHKKLRRETVVAIYVLISFLCGLPMCTKAGYYIFNLFDSYICGPLPLLIICIAELFTVLFLYRKNFLSWFKQWPPDVWPGKLFIMHINDTLKQNLTYIWLCWLFVIPIWLFGMLGMILSTLKPITFENYIYPLPFQIIGYFVMSISPLNDIFVDYFNEFLKCNAFPQLIEYNRESHTFLEQKSDHNKNKHDDSDEQNNDDNLLFDRVFQFDDIKVGDNTKTKTFDKLRQAQMIEWARSERLQLFWRTELYREYKLCKQILRPLTTEKDGSLYSSQGIGGYSRQSIYTAQTLSSTENSNTDYIDELDNITNKNNSGSNVNAIFEDPLLVLELRMPKAFLRPGSRAYSVPVYIESTKALYTKPTESKLNKMSKRSTSSKTSEKKSTSKDTTTMSSLGENMDVAQTSLALEDERYLPNVNEIIYDDDEEFLGFELQSSTNQLKYKYLGSFSFVKGSYAGMQDFIEFLKSTNGYDLYRFWMDCEFYKDTMEGLDDVKNIVARTRLFRDLNEKYHFPFMCHLKNKIRTSYKENKEGSLTHEVFLQVQYDILRRLRIYWCSRYIIHQLFIHNHQSQDNFSSKYELSSVNLYPIDNKVVPNLTEMTQIFLSDDYTNKKTHTKNLILNYKQSPIEIELDRIYSTKFMKKFYKSMKQDKIAGGLFLRYITYNERDLLPLILFCYDVDDFHYSDLDDKVLEGQHALSIINTYLGNSAKLPLNEYLPNIDIKTMITCIKTHEFDKLFFETLYKQALLLLKDAWLRCLRDDIDRLTTAYYLPDQDRNTSSEDEAEDDEEDEVMQPEKTVYNHHSAKKIKESRLNAVSRLKSPNTEMNVTNDVIYVKRPWVERYLSSATSERQQRLIKAIDFSMTDEERQRIRVERLERVKKIETARKKALKAAKQRRLRGGDKRSSISSHFTASTGKNDGTLYIDRILNSSTTKDNKRIILNYFQRRLKSKNIKLDNKLTLVFDIMKFMDATNHLEKQQMLDRMKKFYLDVQSKRTVIPLNEKLTQQLSGGRPDSPFLRSAYKELRNELEDEFVSFCEDCAREFQIESVEEFLSKSSTELTMLFNEAGDYFTNGGDKLGDDDDQTATSGNDEYEKNNDGRGKPTKKHFTELFNLIQDAAVGRYNPKFFYFYAYLTHFVNKDKVPYLDRDLLFCIDVSRIKEIANDAMLQAKLKYILETYLESTTPPAIQIDITNYELNMRMIKSLQKALQASVHEYSAFEEARMQLIKEKLVFYYAGFKNYLFRQNNANDRLITKSTYPVMKTTVQQIAQIKQKPSAVVNVLITEVNENEQPQPERKVVPRKAITVLSRHSTVTPPQDLTAITKTQRVLDARMDEFQRIKSPKVSDVQFPK